MAPEYLTTARLILRRPLSTDADAIFTRCSSEPEVTQFLAWPRRKSMEDARRFLDFSDQEWSKGRAGP